MVLKKSRVLKSFRNIAAGLLVIFIFPIFFQSFHVVWHREHDSNCCEHRHSVCHLITADNHSGPEVDQEKDHCPICDYEISINSLPEHTVFESYISRIEAMLYEMESDNYFPAVVVVKSPRAPPLAKA